LRGLRFPPLAVVILIMAGRLHADDVIRTVAGTGVSGFNGDGIPAVSAWIDDPRGVVADATGNVYLADYGNHRVRRVDAATGTITTVAGSATWTGGYNGDGIQAADARLNGPRGLAFDGAGRLLIADHGNNLVRRVDLISGVITTVAGSMTATGGYGGDGAAATSALLSGPTGLAVDASGDLWVADEDNNAIRRVDHATGFISTAAGTGSLGYNGDGISATTAELYWPYDVAVDAAGNVYIADTGNSRIRKVTAGTGAISTVSGDGSFDYNGDGIPAGLAKLSMPGGIVLDASGNLWLADVLNHRVRRIDAATGTITTMAGSGAAGFTGDGMAATEARLYNPYDVALTPSSGFFIADGNNHRIRGVAPPASTPSPTTVNVRKGAVLAAPSVLDLRVPGSRVTFHVRGNPGAVTEVRVWDAAGNLLGAIPIQLDADGRGEGVLTPDGLNGKRPGLGLYWVKARGGGVDGHSRFLVTDGDAGR